MKNNTHPIFEEIIKPHQPKMKYTAKNEMVYDQEGNIILTVFHTPRLKELIDDDGWDRGKESWLDYRKRTESERDDEQQKINDLAIKIADLMNQNTLTI